MKYFFLGWTAEYEQVMIQNLSQRFNIKTMITPKKIKRLNRYIKKANKLLKRNIISNEWLARHLLLSNKVSNCDILICNEGQVNRGLNLSIVKSFKGKKILLVRDLVDVDFVESMKNFFDKIYSFDKLQCESYGMEYLDQFFPYGVDDVNRLLKRTSESSTDLVCFFLGRNKGRAAAIETIAESLHDMGCVTDFYIVKDQHSNAISKFDIDDTLPYAESIEKSLHCNILADINQEGQAGITLRALESIFFNKKLITTNRSITSQSFFRPDNIFIIGQDNFGDLNEFMRSKATVLPDEILHQFSPDRMLDKITADLK